MTGKWEEILKHFIIHFTMFLTHKKNLLPNLVYGFHNILSKLKTNCTKICPILSSTSVFNIFVKTGGGWDKKCFFFFYYLMLLQKFPEWFYSEQHCSRTLNIQTRFLQDFTLRFSYIDIQVFFFPHATYEKYQI